MSQNFTAAEILEMGIQPIRPDAPAGDPGRDEPQFEVLQGEIRKLEEPDGRQPDWGVVIDAAAELLGRKSKDLLPASYLCLGLFQRDGYSGLVTGLSILKELIDRYWETLYPEFEASARPDGRHRVARRARFEGDRESTTRIRRRRVVGALQDAGHRDRIQPGTKARLGLAVAQEFAGRARGVRAAGGAREPIRAGVRRSGRGR